MTVVTRLDPARRQSPVLVFDGDCGFCTATVQWAERFVRPTATVIAWQFVDLAELGISAEQCQTSIQWVSAPGDVRSEARAAAALLATGRQPWPIVGALMSLPGVVQFANACYRLVARNRYRLPGSTPACQAHRPGGSRAAV